MTTENNQEELFVKPSEPKPQKNKKKRAQGATKKKTRSYGTNDILNWKFEKQKFPKVWADHLGDVPGRFLMYVDGDGGHGKTEYIMQGVVMFSNHYGKVHLNNIEQGKHVQIKQSVDRNDFKQHIKPGKWIYSSITDFDAYLERISKPNSGRVQIIDSISQWKLTAEQIFDMFNRFKKKSFIIVAYKKHFEQNKAIQHLCDVKVRIHNFYAESTSRFGGNQVYDIWPEKHKVEANGLDKINQTELPLQ